jgi:hypothetical protein
MFQEICPYLVNQATFIELVARRSTDKEALSLPAPNLLPERELSQVGSSRDG